MISDFNAIKDKHGLISDHLNKRTTGNGLMYTAEWAWQLNGEFLNGRITKDDFEKERESIRTAYSKCEIHDGYYARTPDMGFGHNAVDDYFGVGLTSFCLDPEMAERVLKSARRNYWMLNEREPGKWRWGSWLGRMPQLVAHLQMAAGETPGIFSLVAWCSSVLLTTRKHYKKQDSWSKAWMMVQVAKGRNKFLDVVCDIFMKKFKQTYPLRENGSEGLGALRNSYGWSPAHPSVKRLKG